MGIGNLLLNWGVFVVGLLLFLFGCLFMVQYSRAYKQHVLRYGRVKFGKKYGTSWDNADTRGAVLGMMSWVVGIPVIVGVLLFFFTGLVKIGVPLWIGCTLGISGVLLYFLSFMLGAGLAKREVDIAFSNMQERRMLEDEEQRQDDTSELL